MGTCKACTGPTYCTDCDGANTATYSVSGKCIACPYPCNRCLDEVTCVDCGYSPELRSLP
jgi:hypothetical protein